MMQVQQLVLMICSKTDLDRVGYKLFLSDINNLIARGCDYTLMFTPELFQMRLKKSPKKLTAENDANGGPEVSQMIPWTALFLAA